MHKSPLIETNIEDYLKQHEQKNLLRFITFGGMGDGKSTLIGRLLDESKLLLDEQPCAIESDSKKDGTQSDEIDSALLVDGLAAERELSDTMDVAYRFFSTDRRKFIVAYIPGHEQCAGNMWTGTSTADAAILMVDARKGILTQTRYHSYLMSLMGISNIVVAINKMDLVGYSEAVFIRVVEEYRAFARQIGLEAVTLIPMSASKGDNITTLSERMPWYQGAALMPHLEAIELDDTRLQRSVFRMPVQWVNRPNLDFRGFVGSIASGIVRPGDAIRVQPCGKTSTVARIVTRAGDLDQAVAGQSITQTLADEVDISRGDVISGIDAPAETADQFEATLVWMHAEAMLPGRRYLMKIGTNTVTALISGIKHQVNVNTLEHIAAKQLELNAIGVCNLTLDRAIAFGAYDDNQDGGGFILIDRPTNITVGAGMLSFALACSRNIHMQQVDVDKVARAKVKRQKPSVLWFTGLSGAGKSTIANLVEKKLHARGQHTYLLDGDNVRHGLNRDLGFTDADRVENIRRVAEVARLMVDAGLIVLCAFISPFRAERRMARDLVAQDEFLEIYIDTPLSVAEDRDPKGLYKKARRGELKNFTGIDSAYEAPEAAEIRIDTTVLDAEAAAEYIIGELLGRGSLRGEANMDCDCQL